MDRRITTEAPKGRKREDIKGHAYSKWSGLFRDLAEGRRIPNARLAELSNTSAFTIHAWMTGKILPPLDDRLVMLADALELDGEERDLFEFEAYMAHTPDWIQHKMRALTDENKALKAKLAGQVLKGQKTDPEVLG